jgi:hypothetical protein
MNPSHFRLTNADGVQLDYTPSLLGTWGAQTFGTLDNLINDSNSRIEWTRSSYEMGNSFVLTLNDPTDIVHRVDLVYYRPNRSPTVDITYGDTTIRVDRMYGETAATSVSFESVPKQTAIFSN